MTGTVIELIDVADELLDEARSAASGRAARTLVSGDGAKLNQTLLALSQGASLQEHTAPGPATLQILRGRALLECGGDSTPLFAGEWIPIPEQPHSLMAVKDTAAILTVVT